MYVILLFSLWVIAFTNCNCISLYLYLYFWCLFERTKKLKLKKRYCLIRDEGMRKGELLVL